MRHTKLVTQAAGKIGRCAYSMAVAALAPGGASIENLGAHRNAESRSFMHPRLLSRVPPSTRCPRRVLHCDALPFSLSSSWYQADGRPSCPHFVASRALSRWSTLRITYLESPCRPVQAAAAGQGGDGGRRPSRRRGGGNAASKAASKSMDSVEQREAAR